MQWIQVIVKTIAVTFKRLYDILATYLLFWVLYLAAVSVVIYHFIPLAWTALEVANPELVWAEMAARIPLDVGQVKLLFSVALHVVIFVVVRRPLARVQPLVERGFDKIADFFDSVSAERWSLRLFGESVFTIIVTILLVPFVVQPTLVRGYDADAWLDRAGNLADGSAVVELRDSVYGFYGRIGQEPVVAERGVDSSAVDAALDAIEDEEVSPSSLAEPVVATEEVGPPLAPVPESPRPGVPRQREALVVSAPRAAQPLMDRWDGDIMDAVEHDPEMFAYVKAFMYVESAGRQYAVSHTGCAGLMQFCAPTAKSAPYRQVFGVGNVYACGCRGASCAVPRDVARALESGQLEKVQAHADDFPCEITDARFDPEKAIEAGHVYIQRLHRAFGGNIYLMYVGYNSGPGVAKKVWVAVGQNPDASLEEIAEQLPAALRPYYGKSADARARSLARVHLPKIEKARQRFSNETKPAEVAMTFSQ